MNLATVNQRTVRNWVKRTFGVLRIAILTWRSWWSGRWSSKKASA